MKYNKNILIYFLNVLEFIFKKGLLFMYFFMVSIVIYIMFNIFFKNIDLGNVIENTNFIKNLYKILTFYHFFLKISISLYLMIKFNPFFKIRYKGKNDRSMIFNSAILLFTSTAIIDPMIENIQLYIKNIL